MRVVRGRLLCLLGLSFLFLVVSSSYGQAGKSYPMIGSEMPNFVFYDLDNYHQKTLSLKELRGKHVILDFWGAGCTACIASFPKVQEMQKKYGDSLNIILIGLKERNRNIREVYSRYRDRDSLTLTSAYDSVSFRKIVPLGVPHLIWIDKQGIVKAITTSSDLNPKNVDSFLKDQPFRFDDYSYYAVNRSFSVNPQKPLLIGGNGGADTSYIFRSVLSEWQRGMGVFSTMPIDSYVRSFGLDKYQATKADIFTLYKIAYFGSNIFEDDGVYQTPILHVKDSSLFSVNYSNPGRKRYNYSLELAKSTATKKKLMAAMRRDLANYFPYCVSVVRELRPYLALVVVDTNRAKNLFKGEGQVVNSWSPEKRVNIVNVDAEYLHVTIGSYLLKDGLILFNETDLHGPVVLSTSYAIDTLSEMRKGLLKYGLDIKEKCKEFSVLKIIDAPDI